MKIFYGTNTGKVREINEDSYLIVEKDDYILCAVADGMGGHNAGEIASETAVSAIKELFNDNFLKHKEIPDFINKSINYANKKIRDKSIVSDDYNGMGTTLAMAIIDKYEKMLYVGNVGDSRVYIVSPRKMDQITFDHSLVAEYIKQGKITQNEAKTHPKRNVITRALGTNDDVIGDVFELKIEKNIKLLLCSDGLTNHLSNDEILEIINDRKNNDYIRCLIDKANQKGGTDNITIIVVEIE